MQSLQEHSEHTFTAIKEYAAARGLTNCMKLTAFLQGFQGISEVHNKSSNGKYISSQG